MSNQNFISHPNTRTLHRGTRDGGAECGQPSDSWATLDAENQMHAVLKYATPPCRKCFTHGYHDLKRVYLNEHTAVACEYTTKEVIESSSWDVPNGENGT